MIKFLKQANRHTTLNFTSYWDRKRVHLFDMEMIVQSFEAASYGTPF